MLHVLFVCLGNICRSPMAEAIFKNQVEQAGLKEEFTIDSAGTASWHIGNPPHEGTINKLAEYQISTEGQACRQLRKEDFMEFDYIVAMDASNLANIKQVEPATHSAKIIRLLDLTEQPKDLPDPYYTGDFQETYDLVQAGCQALLEKISREKERNKNK